jgi:hypothetical protein
MNKELRDYMAEIWPNFTVGKPMLRHLTAYIDAQVSVAYRRGYQAGHRKGTHGKSKRELRVKYEHKNICPVSSM